jgi:hypothetical protein
MQEILNPVVHNGINKSFRYIWSGDGRGQAFVMFPDSTEVKQTWNFDCKEAV